MGCGDRKRAVKWFSGHSFTALFRFRFSIVETSLNELTNCFRARSDAVRIAIVVDPIDKALLTHDGYSLGLELHLNPQNLITLHTLNNLHNK
jgi:hypothetical protein